VKSSATLPTTNVTFRPSPALKPGLPPRWRTRWARVELTTLLLFALVTGAALAFIQIAENVTEGDTGAFDQRILLALRDPTDRNRPLGPVWLAEFGRDLTALGGAGVLTLLTTAVVVFLVLQREKRLALLVLVAVVSGTILGSVLKEAFGRPRPDLVPHGSAVYTSSFPSGHSMMSAVVYLTLGALLTRVLPRRALKAYVLALAVVTSILVGISRVYLGVHWPTDVLGGWAAGAAWAVLWWLIANWLERWRRAARYHAQQPSPPQGETTQG